MLSHLRARWTLARLVLATCLLPAACDRDAPTDASSLKPLAQPVAPSSASAPSPPPLPPPLDFELERRFSPPLYADFAALVSPVSGLSEKLTSKATDLVTDAGAEALEGIAVPLGDDRERGARDLDDAPAPERIQPLAPGSMPTVTADAEVDVGHRGVAILDAKGRNSEIRLLGVRIDTEGRKDAANWVSRALRKGQVIVSSDRWGTTRAGSLVLLPGDGVVLNVELLRHGFARLDQEHAEVLRSFPLLVDAAWDALENRTGLARDWGKDEAYVAAVAALR